MSRPILAAVDPAHPGAEALELARALERATGAPIVVVRLTDDPKPEVTLDDASRAMDACLVVLGPGHRGRLAAGLAGGTADRLARAAACPIAVAPAGYKAPATGIHSIGVALADTPESRGALHDAARFAAQINADLEVISVAPAPAPIIPVPLAVGVMPPSVAEIRASVERFMQREIERLPQNLHVTSLAPTGDAAAIMAAASERWDLLVCASRRRGPVLGAALGSFTHRLLHDSRCPLLIEPRGVSHGLADTRFAYAPAINT
jgi:nucleotide-binding universal stress UspA family protein